MSAQDDNKPTSIADAIIAIGCMFAIVAMLGIYALVVVSGSPQ